ncbi:P-loop containing nucleoside triphosphate hydrolase protein [Phakopsora pachyrhizi]|uniref:RNA helicase n=1 Tax=Phakopsora pachyrhizi TaxID=170000 RepID=A0AAV0BP81_PHAPC|nr:P-loop containing nucleoside triphosphate hydrolase protein [Phakopsora pachyrhizi]
MSVSPMNEDILKPNKAISTEKRKKKDKSKKRKKDLEEKDLEDKKKVEKTEGEKVGLSAVEGKINDLDQKKRDKKRKKKEKMLKKSEEEDSNPRQKKVPKVDNGPAIESSKDLINDKQDDQSSNENNVKSQVGLNLQEIEQFVSKNKITYDPIEIMSQYPPVLSFDAVNVHKTLRKAFENFETPSPIQSAVWPALMAGKDVIGIAETGSGKTLAFALPAIQLLLDNRNKSTKDPREIKILVIAPTRELAMQTESTVSELGKLLSPPANSLCVYGGVDKSVQRKALSGNKVQIVAGTPGRLLDLSSEGILKLNNVDYLVLDEADRMLDKGFENDIRAIIGLCRPSISGDGKKSRLTAMFSATWPMSVRKLASDFMFEPIRILVGDDELTASCSVEQTVEVLEDSRGKEWKLLKTLNQLKESSKGKKPTITSNDKVIVFALYKKEAQRIHQFLIRKGFEVCCIEGDMSQDKRTKSLEDFKTGKAKVLVATDVAARGLDIPKVEVVINVTFPLTIEDYIHRIGRTGRAGRTGKSITFFTDEDKSHAGELMRVLKDANQVVPEDLKQWGGQIKKKSHAAYGDHYREVDLTVKGNYFFLYMSIVF